MSARTIGVLQPGSSLRPPEGQRGSEMRCVPVRNRADVFHCQPTNVEGLAFALAQRVGRAASAPGAIRPACRARPGRLGRT